MNLEMIPALSGKVLKSFVFVSGFLLLALVFLFVFSSGSAAKILYVDDDVGQGGDGSHDRPFKGIQDAVSASREGDTVLVWAGEYQENVVVDVTISLVGNGSEETIIDGGGEGYVVRITADWVNISGFTIRESGNKTHYYTNDYSGIWIESGHNQVLGNTITSNYIGIWIHGHGKDGNNTISGNVITGNLKGLMVGGSRFTQISNNLVSSQEGNGIHLYTCEFTTLKRNVCEKNDGFGIFFESCNDKRNILENNTCRFNKNGGIILHQSRFVELRSNRMTGDGLRVSGSDLDEFNEHDIDTSNTVNGKPIYYMKNLTGGDIPRDAGQLILVNCSNMAIENMSFSEVCSGIQLRYSSFIRITNVSCLGTGTGIDMDSSHNNRILDSNCSNGKYGFEIRDSDNTLLSGNIFSSNSDSGIGITHSSHNTFTGNFLVNNSGGFRLQDMENCTLTGNIFRPDWVENGQDYHDGRSISYGISLRRLSYNTLSENLIGNLSEDAIVMRYDSNHNVITRNIIRNNKRGISFENKASGNLITHNQILENGIGIRLFATSENNVVAYNTFIGNSLAGINASENGVPVKARYNWWGDDSGPHHPEENPSGKGDNVTSSVDFSYWFRDEDEPFLQDHSELFVWQGAPEGGFGSREGPLKTIREAVELALVGSTIHVWEGTYHENIKLNRTLNLVGNGSSVTIINASKRGDVIRCIAPWTNISGFAITGSRLPRHISPVMAPKELPAGIFVKSNFNTISGNSFFGNTVGINLCYIEKNRIGNNSFWNNSYRGTVLYRSQQCRILDNTFREQEGGIYLVYSDLNLLAGNNCSNLSNTDTNRIGSQGIYLKESDHNFILNNTISGNRRGISLSSSRENLVENNTITENSDGIYLGESTDNLMMNNTIFGNRNGILGGKFSSGSFYNNTARYNSICGNTDYGINLERPGPYAINASNNWWGHESGPYHPDLNPEGKGDRISDSVNVTTWLNEDGSVHVPFPDEEEDLSSPGDELMMILLGLGLACTLCCVALAFHFSEPFRFGFLELIAPFYTRLSEEKIERDIREQNSRGRIYQFVKDCSGVNLSEIKSETDSGYGTTVYHLSVLLREGYLRSAVNGKQKLFWVKAEFPGAKEAALTTLQQQILDLLKKQGRMTRSEVLKKLEFSRSTLYFNMDQLLSRGLVKEEKQDGKYYFCLPDN